MGDRMIEQAKNPFHFCTRQNLTYLTGLRASNLAELLAGIKSASERSIYHHTHHFLDRHEFLSPEPPNDFAYWITNILQERVLGEKVASIDLREFSTLAEIRTRILEVIKASKQRSKPGTHHRAPAGEEFHFMEAQSFVFPTNYVAHNLSEFKECLERVSVQSIYFHVFEARLRQKESDFATWLSTSLEEKGLARAMMSFDPYTQTLENLRRTLIRLVEKRLDGRTHGNT